MKKPMFKARIGWAVQTPQDGGFFATESRDGAEGEMRVRITDASELTPEKAVEKVLQLMQDVESMRVWIHYAAHAAGMTARVVNGKVRVRRVKK